MMLITQQHTLRLLASLLALAVLLVLMGCGGGGTPVVYQEPTENPALPGAIGGTLFTMDNGMLGEAQDAVVSLYEMADDPETDPALAATRSIYRGGYHFDNVPAGDYQLTATVTTASGELTGAVSGVRVRGGLPTLMVNILLGRADNMATFTGQVYTLNGLTHVGVPAATVTAEVNGNTPTSGPRSAFFSSTADGDGNYTLILPAGALHYYIAAHSGTSMVTASEIITGVSAGQTVTRDLQLNAAEPPVFAALQFTDYFATTLPEPGAEASQQALLARIAVTRARRASAERLNRLLELAQRTRATAATRAAGGFVEYDLEWTILSDDVGVQGFHVYRANAVAGPFTRIGSTQDPYEMYYYDTDPVLVPGAQAYYSVKSYAANGVASAPMTPLLLRSMPIFTVQGPDDDATIPPASVLLTWTPVSMGLSYVVLIFENEPVNATVAPSQVITLPSTATSYSLASLDNGEYWWAVAAYNNPNPEIASAGAFTPFKKVTVAQ
ncbi:MAG: hypothetical protein ACYC7E_13750 [Armatimonadota bacterium]